MPFKEGGSVESDFVAGQIGSALPLARLVVDPDKVLSLKHGVEEERDRVRDWLYANRWRLHDVPQPGTDPCSGDACTTLGENGQSAVHAAEGYVAQLGNVAAQLDEIAKAYRLTEEDNTGKLGGGIK
jgi:hypothetical protein